MGRLDVLRESTHPGLLRVEPLVGRRVAVLGYGNQGRAHALNLRDSGVSSVVIGSRSGSAGARRAAEDGFEPRTIEEASELGDLLIIALPDEVHAEVYDESIAGRMRPDAVLGFLHGFSIRFGFITPPPPEAPPEKQGIGIVLVAPKGPGTTLRALFERGLGLPCLFAVHQENARGDAEAIGLAWAAGIGAGRSGVIRTTFAEEAETDLFGEQAVLCGGVSELILAAFETLVEEGYPPPLAYLECCHELKQVADLLYERGLAGMHRAISSTAEFGAFDAGPKVVDARVRKRLREILDDVRSGAFAERFGLDAHRGFPWFNEKRAALEGHEIEEAGREIRALMPWLGEKPRA